MRSVALSCPSAGHASHFRFRGASEQRDAPTKPRNRTFDRIREIGRRVECLLSVAYKFMVMGLKLKLSFPSKRCKIRRSQRD